MLGGVVGPRGRARRAAGAEAEGGLRVRSRSGCSVCRGDGAAGPRASRRRKDPLGADPPSGNRPCPPCSEHCSSTLVVRGARSRLFPQIYRDFPAGLRARFDIVTWDPRGIGGSTPVRCFASEQEEERFFAGVPIAGSGFPVGRAQIDRSIRRYRQFGRRCGRRNGALLEHLSTADDARDLDLFASGRWRADDQLHQEFPTAHSWARPTRTCSRIGCERWISTGTSTRRLG